MAVYPTSPAFAYPLTRTLEFNTKVVAGTNGTEQRWQLTPGQESFTLVYPRLSLSERDTLLSFFDASKGDFASDIDFTLGATTFSGCYIAEGSLKVTERTAKKWEVNITLVQCTRTSDAGTLASDFPVLSTGAKVQLPYEHGHDFDNVTVRTEGGGRSAWYNRAAARLSWSAGGTVLTDAEAEAIWEMFSRAQGRWGTFAFTDPDSGTRYTGCRFADDKLVRRYVGVNQNDVQARIIQAL